MKNVQITVDEETLAQIDRIGRPLGLKRSEIVRRALRDWVQRHAVESFEQEWIEALKKSRIRPRVRRTGRISRLGLGNEPRRCLAVRPGPRAGRRPALILPRQGVIRYLNKLTVAEITPTGKGYPTEVRIGHSANLPKESFVQLDNIQTVPKDQFLKYLGTLDVTVMRAVGQKLILALGLEDLL
jgi:mRNA-degrading endonuclease toxin of MazEF toxin-antitoxin module/predicted transcriptional regulator